MAKSKQTLRRLIPYSNPRKICGWLEEMAQEGYHLKEIGTFGIATFEQGSPANVHYMADPYIKDKGLITEDWECRTTYGNFSFYVTSATHPAPLLPCPDLSKSAWARMERTELVCCFLFPLLLCWNLHFVLIRQNTCPVLPQFALIAFCLLLPLVITDLGRLLASCFVYRKIRKSLVDAPTEFSQPCPGTGTGQRFPFPFFRSLLFWALLLSIAGSLYFAQSDRYASELPQIPVIHMEDYEGDWHMVPHEQTEYHYQEHSNFLVPETFFWKESGDLQYVGAASLSDSGASATLYGSYHRASSVAIAKTLANQYLKKDQQLVSFEVDTSGLPVDQCWVHCSRFPIFILREGTVVVRIEILTGREVPFTQDEILQWARCLAESIAE